MTDPSAPDEHRLFEAACSGRLDESARGDLQQLLRTSPDARRRYLDHAAVHADLFGAVRVARVLDGLKETLDADTQDAAVSRLSTRGRSTVVAVVVALATAAVVMLVIDYSSDTPAGVELASTELSDNQNSQTNRSEQSVGGNDGLVGGDLDSGNWGRWPGLVARINRIENVVWEAGSRAYAEADVVAAGESIVLAAGLVEIEFRQGAVVVLEGPACLIADNANAASLVQGKLAAVAPPWATGFRIDTPGIDVVDHGTEFAVNVSGNGSSTQVNVVVTEGEVEVLADEQVEGGRRLRAGQGVQSSDGEVEVGDDAAARQLTKQLPNRIEFKNAIVVGDRWSDAPVGVDGEPCREGAWRFYTNGSGIFGDPKSYNELAWDASEGCYRPTSHATNPWLNKHVRVNLHGGHPGKGRDQVEDKIDRYSITGFVVPEDGVYRIEAGWLERRWARRWDLDQVLDVAVHVNDSPIVMQEFCDRDCFVAFRQPLGKLSAGDTIYVGVGPNGTDFNDKFRWGYYVVRDTDTSVEKSQARSDDVTTAG